MAYGVKYYAEQKPVEDGITYRVEVLQKNYSSGTTELTAGDRMASLTYEELNPRTVLDNPIQPATLTFRFWIENDSDLSLYRTIISGDEDEYLLRLKKDGSVQWTGKLLPDLNNYSEAGYPIIGELKAKDLSYLKGRDYNLVSQGAASKLRVPDHLQDQILEDLGFELELVTYTNWEHPSMTAGNDYLDELYKDQFHLRDYPDRAISKYDALIEILKGEGLLLRQASNRWELYQLPYIADDTIYDRWTYDIDGLQTTSESNVDIDVSIDRSSRYVLPSSTSKDFAGIKKVTQRFNHKTTISSLSFDASYIHDDSLDRSGDTIDFSSDGFERIIVTGNVRMDAASGAVEGTAQFFIRVGSYYWNPSTNAWDNSSGVILIDVDLIGDASGSGTVFADDYKLTTSTVPSLAEKELEVQFQWGTAQEIDGTSKTVNEIEWQGWNANIVDGTQASSSASITYISSQGGNYSLSPTLNDVIFGTGPTRFSRSAVWTGGGGTYLDDRWSIRGEAQSTSLIKLSHYAFINFRHTSRRWLRADVWGEYNPSNIISYDSSRFFFLGGTLHTDAPQWTNGSFIELNFGAVSVTTSEFYNDVESANGVSGTTQGTGTTGNYDSRYLQILNNLSDLDNAATALTNLGLTATASELNRLDGDLATVRSNLGLGTGDSPQFAGLTLTGNGIYSGAEVTVDGGFNPSTDAIFRGFYDSDGTTGVTSTAYDAVFRHIIESTTPTSRMALLFGGTEQFSVDESGGLTAGTADFTGQVDVHDGTFTWKRDTEHEISFTTPSAQTGIVFDANALGDRSRFDIENHADVTVSSRFIQLGFNDQGGQIQIYNDNRIALLDETTVNNNLFVTGGLFAQEFVVEQKRIISEPRFGPYGAKIESVTGSAGSETITLSDEFGAANPLVAGAIILIQARTGQSSGTIVKKIQRKVSSISGMDAVLTTTGITWGTANDVGAIEAGDHVAPDGHVSDATLDHYIDFDIANVAIPAIRFIDEKSDVGGGFEPLRVGGMDGFDASITGDIGIAGATKTDGAVFWVTEDEAKLGGFTFDDNSLVTDDIYIGDQIQNATELLRMGMWEVSPSDRFPSLRIHDPSGNGKVIMFYRESNSTYGLIVNDPSGNQVFSAGDTNRIAGSYFDATDLWFGDADKALADWKMNNAGLEFNVDGPSDFIGIDWSGSGELTKGNIRGSTKTIADDAAVRIIGGLGSGTSDEHSILMVWAEDDTRACCVNVLPGNIPQVLFKTGPTVDTGTGNPTGTTGTDGAYGIYVEDGRPTHPVRIHIENRTGTELIFHYLSFF